MSDVESMAACLLADWNGTIFRLALAELRYDPHGNQANHAAFWSLARAALDHIDYLPSRVAAREKHAAQPPYQWLGAEAEHAHG